MNKERREIVLKKITNWTKDWDRKNPFFSHNLTHDLKLHSFNDEQTEIRDVLRYVADDPNYVFKDKWGVDCMIKCLGKDFRFNRHEEDGQSVWSKNEANLYILLDVKRTYKAPSNKNDNPELVQLAKIVLKKYDTGA